MSVKVHLLGSPRVELAGSRVSFDTRKALALLAYLALSPGPQRREALATLLWPDYEQERAYANLRRTLWSLKKGIGEARLEIDAETLALKQEDLWLDVRAFRASLAEADSHEHEDADRCPDCLASLRTAVDLYDDDFLSGFTIADSPPFDEWHFFEAESLRQDLARTLQRLAQMYRERRKPEEGIPYARRWVALDPLHEPAQRLLMRLYAEAGQRAAALRQYEECERVLEEKLGFEPEGETTRLHQRIQNRQVGPSSETIARTSDPVTVPHNLPPEVTSFVGRRHERETISGLLREPSCWMLTLTGPGGIGKTRLALSVARELLSAFPGGIYWVSLEALRDPALVLPTVAQRIEVREEGDGDLLASIVEALRARGKTLLLLDNFEQVLDAAPVLSQLYDGAPEVTFLVTSREVLHLYGEQEFPVAPLRLPKVNEDGTFDDLTHLASNEAVALFVQQASAARPGFRLTEENAPDVAALCLRLDGIPLAIELAAARIKLFSPQSMLTQLESRSTADWLRSSASDRPHRHQSLRDTLEWSFALLAPEEQTLFGQLAIFSGGFTLAAAAEVCSTGTGIVEGVSALVDKSLVQSGGEVTGDLRFGMLQPIHEYATERLEGSGETPATAKRHLRYFLKLAERAEPQLKGPAQLEWLTRLEVDRDNFRAALTQATEQRADAEAAQRLAAALLWFWQARGRAKEGLRWLRAALAMEPPGPAKVRGRALSAAGLLATHVGETDAGQRLLQESISLSREENDRANLAYALSWLSNTEWDLRQKQSLEAESEALFRQVGDSWGLADLLWQQGLDYLWWVRDVEAARTRLEASVDLFLATGDQWRIHTVLNTLGAAAAADGNFGKADNLYREAFAICRRMGDSYGTAWAIHLLGLSAMASHHYEEAAELMQQSVDLFRRCASRWGLCSATMDLGTLARLQGEYARAKEFIRDARELARKMHHQTTVSFATQELGYAHLYAGEVRQAIPHFEEVLRLSAKKYPLHAALAVPGVLAVAASLVEGDRVMRLLRAALALRSTVVQELGFKFNQEEYERHLALARDLLRERGDSPEPEAGPRMSREEAFDVALDEAAMLCQVVETNK